MNLESNKTQKIELDEIKKKGLRLAYCIGAVYAVVVAANSTATETW